MEGETEPENGVASDTDHPALTGPSRAMPEDIAPAQFLGFDYEIRKKVRTGFSLVGKDFQGTPRRFHTLRPGVNVVSHFGHRTRPVMSLRNSDGGI